MLNLTLKMEMGKRQTFCLVRLAHKLRRDKERRFQNIPHSLCSVSGTAAGQEVSLVLTHQCGFRKEICQGMNTQKTPGTSSHPSLLHLSIPAEQQHWGCKTDVADTSTLDHCRWRYENIPSPFNDQMAQRKGREQLYCFVSFFPHKLLL